ncbi:hypothetical protein R3P38DRAFT_148856 [Favolaschia claudopus]|uniref:Secreted protein n=1 Tax=Favolaschia claudopus TaxID=2862362 RepID=A0AAV9ZUD1_9AGAR
MASAKNGLALGISWLPLIFFSSHSLARFQLAQISSNTYRCLLHHAISGSATFQCSFESHSGSARRGMAPQIYPQVGPGLSQGTVELFYRVLKTHFHRGQDERVARNITTSTSLADHPLSTSTKFSLFKIVMSHKHVLRNLEGDRSFKNMILIMELRRCRDLELQHRCVSFSHFCHSFPHR